MKIRLALSGLLGVALCATATANNFSVSGPGGVVPDGPAGGGLWNAAPSWPVLTSTVSVANPVTSITAVKLQGLTHTYRGDIHVFLTDPGGTRSNIVVRSGFTGAGTGDSGNYNLGDYVFVESGGLSIAQGATNIVPGTYNQYLNTGGGMWTSGTYVINNTPLSGITGAAGTWTLTIVDWYGIDIGSITGWTLEGTDSGGPVVFCEPGAAGVIPCPCANAPSGPGRGCNNFGALSGGASLTATGTASLSADTLVLSATGENNTATTVFWGGNALTAPAGVAHAAGVRCVLNAGLKRLYTGSASVGAISRPGMGDPTVSAAQGGISAGQTRYYFNIYRDPNAAIPCGASASTVNLTNALAVTWDP